MNQSIIQWDPLHWEQTPIEWKKIWSKENFSIGLSAVLPNALPGQYVQIGTTINGEKIVRPLSLVNVAEEKCEFYIAVRPEGLFSQAISAKEVGDFLWIARRSMGNFSINHVQKCRNLFLISTGTGITPYLSFFRDKKIDQIAEKIILIHGTRYYEQAYEDELKTHAARLSDKLMAFLAISDSKSWHNFQLKHENEFSFDNHNAPFNAVYAGRITKMLSCEKVGALIGSDAFCHEKDVAFVCGNAEMVREIKQWFCTIKGFKKYSSLSQSGLFIEGY